MAEKLRMILVQKIIGNLVIIVVGWLIYPPLGIALAIFSTGQLRTKIIYVAPFWNATGIILSGVLCGVFMGVGLYMAVSAVHVPVIGKVLLYIEATLGLLYFGYRPDPMDRYRKAQQMSFVATLSYFVISALLFAIF